MMKTILITGAAGFIGSNLAKKLLSNDFDVIGIDNMEVGCVENIEDILSHKRFTFGVMDCQDPDISKFILSSDLIVHLAAYKIPRYGQTLECIKNNSFGTYNVFELNKRKKSPVIMASTSDVYGKGNVPFAETQDLIIGSPEHRRWTYAVSKLWDENLAFGYLEKEKIPFTAIRFFNVYGPNCALDWSGGVIPQVIEKVLKNDKIEIHGDGLQVRCYSYIDDVIDALYQLILNNDFSENILNIGDNRPYNVRALVKIIKELVPDAVNQIENVPYKSFFGKYEDVKDRIPDISKAKKLLGWEPKTDLKEGLKKTIDWQKKRMEVMEND